MGWSWGCAVMTSAVSMQKLIVEEVSRQAPSCSAKTCAAWSFEAESDTLVIPWVSSCLVKSVRSCADPASELLRDNLLEDPPVWESVSPDAGQSQPS